MGEFLLLQEKLVSSEGNEEVEGDFCRNADKNNRALFGVFETHGAVCNPFKQEKQFGFLFLLT